MDQNKMERTEENRYRLGIKARQDLLKNYYNIDVVAKDLENMAVGQWCNPKSPTRYAHRYPYKIKSATEFSDELIGALGDNAGNYDVSIEEEEHYKRVYVERVR